MRKTSRILFLHAAFLLTGSAQAEWFQLGRTENFRVYLDQSSLRRNGDFVQSVQLMDFTTAQWVDERHVVGSLKSVVEYDCTQPRARTLTLEATSEQMGEGRVVSFDKIDNPQWETLPAKSTAESTWKLICRK